MSGAGGQAAPGRAGRRRAVKPAAASGGPRPRSDGRRVLFEVVEGERTVACAISQHALRDLTRSRGRRGGAADLLQCFAEAWPGLEQMALRTIQARRFGPLGLLYIWPDELAKAEAAKAAPET